LQQTNLTLLELKSSSAQAIQTLAAITEKHDPYAAGHSRKTAELAAVLGKQLGLSSEKIDLLRTAAALHDVGKIAIPGEILSKPALLSPIEHDLVKLHVSEGIEILRAAGLPKALVTTVLQHHERIDGSGYPLGLKDAQISLEAKILAVADSMEAMLSHRPYRVAMTVEAALNELIALKGSHYDPAIVDACVTVFRQHGFTFSAA
jgi:putative nucleotidyltransferase with HDIG domain